MNSINVNFKAKAFRAASFVLLGYGLSQVFRLCSNWVLTRLLSPELYGIIAVAHVFHRGLGLLSDLGIEPGIIRSERSDDKTFLNTAWTLQVYRGLLLFLLSIAIAYPVSVFYNEKSLLFVLPALGTISIFQGFQSTSLAILNKELKQGKVTYVELISQLVSIAVMIVIAYLFRNIWALVLGAVISPIVKSIWSHFLPYRIKPSFKLEKTAVTELLSFGKWIFLSTAMMFLATQADRLLLGKLFPISLFGVYHIAAMYAELPKDIMNSLGNRVIYPLLSKFSELPRDEIRAKIAKARFKLLLPLILLVSGLTCFGDLLMEVLYDSRYIEAAWILPLLSLGIWPFVLHLTIDRILYVIGKPNYMALGNSIKFIYMLVSVPLFYKMGGPFGAVIAVMLNDIPVYISVNIGLRKEKLSLLKQDLLATGLLAILILSGLLFRNSVGLGLPGMDILFNGN